VAPKSLFQHEITRTSPFRLQPQIAAISCPVPVHSPASAREFHDPKAENHSIPIEYGPAQFNAFYRQCSGQYWVRFHQHLPPEHCR
jgi:hypothetical protein